MLTTCYKQHPQNPSDRGERDKEKLIGHLVKDFQFRKNPATVLKELGIADGVVKPQNDYSFPLSKTRGYWEINPLLMPAIPGTMDEFDAMMTAARNSENGQAKVVIVTQTTGSGRTKQVFWYGMEREAVVEIWVTAGEVVHGPWMSLDRRIQGHTILDAADEVQALICEYVNWTMDVVEGVEEQLGELSTEDKRYIALMSRNGYVGDGVYARYEADYARMTTVQELGKRWKNVFGEDTRPVVAIDALGELSCLRDPIVKALDSLGQHGWGVTLCGTHVTLEEDFLGNSIRVTHPKVRVKVSDMWESLGMFLNVPEDAASMAELQPKLSLLEGRPMLFFDFFWPYLWEVLTTGETNVAKAIRDAADEKVKSTRERFRTRSNFYVGEMRHEKREPLHSMSLLVWDSYMSHVLHGGKMYVAGDRAKPDASSPMAQAMRVGTLLVDRDTQISDVRSEPLVLESLCKECDDFLAFTTGTDPVADALVQRNRHPPLLPSGTTIGRWLELIAWRLIRASRIWKSLKNNPPCLSDAFHGDILAGEDFIKDFELGALLAVDAYNKGLQILLDDDGQPRMDVLAINLPPNIGADIALWTKCAKGAYRLVLINAPLNEAETTPSVLEPFLTISGGRYIKVFYQLFHPYDLSPVECHNRSDPVDYVAFCILNRGR